jgi:hypothetical protein
MARPQKSLPQLPTSFSKPLGKYSMAIDTQAQDLPEKPLPRLPTFSSSLSINSVPQSSPPLNQWHSRTSTPTTLIEDDDEWEDENDMNPLLSSDHPVEVISEDRKLLQNWNNIQNPCTTQKYTEQWKVKRTFTSLTGPKSKLGGKTESPRKEYPDDQSVICKSYFDDFEKPKFQWSVFTRRHKDENPTPINTNYHASPTYTYVTDLRPKPQIYKAIFTNTFGSIATRTYSRKGKQWFDRTRG